MRIKNKITVTFLTIAIISLLCLAALSFFSARNALISALTNRLETLAGRQANTIQTFFDGLRDSIGIAQDYYNIKSNLPIMIKFSKNRVHPDFIKAKDMLDGPLRKWLEIKEEVNDIMLVSPEGKVVYSANEGHVKWNLDKALPDPGGTAFEEGKNGIFISQIFHSPREGRGYEFGLLVTAPVFDFEKQFIGVVAFEINMGPIYKNIQDAAGLGKTGEMLMARKEGDHVLFLNPLRHDPGAALKRRVRYEDETSIPAQEAAGGRNGSGVVRDYRNKVVLSAWRYMPTLDLGIVAKIDLEEILTPVITLRNRIALFCLVIIILIAAASLVIAELISTPIHMLHKGAEIIGGGNLDYKVGTDTKDEIGQLSRAFDRMTGDLKKITASRDELDKEITEHKKAEAELEITNERLSSSKKFSESLLKTVPFGMDIVDTEGNIIFISDKLKSVIGGGITGKKCWELYRDDKKRCDNCPLITGIKLGATASIEAGGCFGGREFQIFHTGMLYDGKLAVLEMFLDITERKKAERTLQEAVRAKSNFTSMVSHELRTPLGTVKESISQVLEGMFGGLTEGQRKFLDIAKRNIDRLVRLINDVLDFQKLEIGKAVFDMRNNDINEVVKETKEMMNIIAKEKGLDLMLDLDKDLPKVKCDRDKISQLLSNLVSNSLKLTEKGGVAISTARGDNIIRVSVKDTGPGIKKEDMPRLFQQYEQLERKTGGTGLGLAIALEIIKAHGGKIWAESKFGQGTTMHFILPVNE